MTVECPRCGEHFDAVKASYRKIACLGCQSTWTKLHAEVEPEIRPELRDSFERGFEVVAR